MASRKQSDQMPLDQQSDKHVAMNIDPVLASGGSPLKFEDKFRHFARTTLLQRECSSFIPKPLKGEGFAESEIARTCYCGRKESWHQDRGIKLAADKKAKWTPETQTKVKPTAAYGRIEFTGFGNQTESSCYARVDYSTSPETLWTLLSDVWGLPTPKLVLSVTGGAMHFNMKPRLANAFKQGLIDVASSTDAWIVTGGTATGVMKYVGDALKEHELSTGFADSKRLVAIGIAAWGCIDNNVCLEDPDGDGSFPAVYSIRDCAEGFAPLDHNHTSFILVDNGTANIYGTEIALRANLEAHIRTKCAASGVNTPVVLIVCEGGVNTLEQTRDAIKCAIPVVVIKGSGRAADIISAAYRMTKPKHGDEQSSFSDDYRMKMETLIARMFGNPNQDIIDKAVGHLEMILSQRTLITIFEMSDVNCRDLDKAVLSALLKAKKANPESQINLALIWNRADIARHEIFTLENRKQWQHIALDDAMFDALVQGKHQFVQLFIDNGVQLNAFLTIKRLRDIYRASIQANDTMSIIFKSLIHKAKMYEDLFSFGCSRVGDENSDACLLRDVGKVINLLLNDEYNCMYTEERFVVRSNTPEPKEEERRRASMTKFYDCDFKSPERELFIWALLYNKAELADILWKMCTDPIGGALVSCRLLKSLAKEAAHQEEIDVSESLMRQAAWFEEAACGVLNSCYCRNKDIAHRLLTRELNNWGKVTLFALAESAHLMDFMKLGCCQTKLNAIWFGKMVEYTQDYKIIMVLICPLLIGMIHFKSKEAALTVVSQVDESFQEFPAERSETKVHRNVAPIIWLCQKTHRARADVIGPLRALYEFYTAPVAKFYLSMGFYVIYLCLFTYVTLAKLEPMTIDKKFTMQGLMEAILWGWALCFFLEEIRQVVRREARSLFFKMVNHMKSFWNILDLFIFLLFVVAVVLRLQPQPDPYARVVYAVTLMLSYLRFMETFYASKAIGPKIIMIQRMLKDLVFFICILVIFILSFGFAMQSLLYPNMKFSSGLLLDAVYKPYSQVFGELAIDKSDGATHCTSNVTEYNNGNSGVELCPERTWLVRVLFAVYMMLTNVLLMNILIAMFSYTFQAVQDNSEKVWRFYRYSVIYEYFDAPALPVPFVLLVHIKRWMYFCYRRFCSHTFYANTGFKERLPLEDNLRLSTFEKTERDRFLAKRSRMTFEQMDHKLNETGTRLQQVLEDIQDIKETLVGEADQRATSSRGRSKSAIDCDRPLSPSQLAPQIVSMEEKIDRQTQLMHDLIKALTKASNA